jgi:hypothetical protein
VPRGSTSAPQQKKFSPASKSVKVVVAEHTGRQNPPRTCSKI